MPAAWRRILIPLTKITLARHLLLTILILTARQGFCTSDTYTHVSAQIEQLSVLKSVCVTEIGKSIKGRPIYAVTITRPDAVRSICRDKGRIVVLCGQHGDEPLPVYSALQLMTSMAAANDGIGADLLGRAVVVFVPVVNPDGFVAHRRYNAAGIDLNRDWSDPDQPETIAVHQLINRLKPHVLIDEHEWADDDPYRPNCMEVPCFGHGAPMRMARLLAYNARTVLIRNGIPLQPTYYRPQSDSRMAHRWYTQMGISCMLVETSSSWSEDKRRKAYSEVVTAVISSIDSPPDPAISRNLALLQSRHGSAAACIASGYIEQPRTGGLHTEPAVLLALLTAVVFIMIRAASPQDRHSYQRPRLRTHGDFANRTFSLTDAVNTDASVHARLSMISHNKMRPSDR